MSHPIHTRSASPHDLDEISRLHARVFGPGRFARSAYRVREGQEWLSPHCRVAGMHGRIIAAVRITAAAIGGKAGAALLGPVAVDPDFRGQGYARKLVGECLENMRTKGVRLVVLVGDMPYYHQFGFEPVPPGSILFPGPVNPARILALELQPGTLAGYKGLVTAAV